VFQGRGHAAVASPSRGGHAIWGLDRARSRNVRKRVGDDARQAEISTTGTGVCVGWLVLQSHVYVVLEFVDDSNHGSRGRLGKSSTGAGGAGRG